jgi:hypothetical protein
MWSYNPTGARSCGLGYSQFARHYFGNHYCFLFLPVLRCFSSRGWLSFEYYAFSIVGCPIRKCRDISLVCSSPCLIAAYHVLRRLSDPRHPPCALIRFKNFQFLNTLMVSLPPKVFSTRFFTYYFPICQRTYTPNPLKEAKRLRLIMQLRTARPLALSTTSLRKRTYLWR